ncbi:uncharacterized protein C11orf24 homolog [Genypterus blacodes]|uniref:uncharacterized protein C11orf24 homolog n=1 Tax=Genypterus blacodes TaxID=154954 RepID=UPI003F75BADE
MSLFASALHLQCPWVRLHLLCLLLTLPHSLCLTVAKRELRLTPTDTLTPVNCSGTCDDGGATENKTAKHSSDITSTGATQVLLQSNVSSLSEERPLDGPSNSNQTFSNSSTIPLSPVSAHNFNKSDILKTISEGPHMSPPPTEKAVEVHPPPLTPPPQTTTNQRTVQTPSPSVLPPTQTVGLTLPPAVTVPASVSPTHTTKSVTSTSSKMNNVSTNSGSEGNLSPERPNVPPNASTTAGTSPPTATAEVTQTRADPTATSTNTITRVIPMSTNMPSSSPKAATTQPNEQNKETPQGSTTTSPPTQTQTITATPTTTTNTAAHRSEVVAKGTRATVVEVAGAAGPSLSMDLMDKASLLAVLLFGLLFFVGTVLVFVTQAYESYRRKDYTQVDYLINGMYTDSGV